MVGQVGEGGDARTTVEGAGAGPVEVDRRQAGRAGRADVEGVVVADVEHIGRAQPERLTHEVERARARLRDAEGLRREQGPGAVQKAGPPQLGAMLGLCAVGEHRRRCSAKEILPSLHAVK